MRLLLDSQVFIWAMSGSRNLRREVGLAIASPDNDVLFSVASAWELWLKHEKKPISTMLDGGPDSLERALQEASMALLDISLAHAFEASRLPLHHRDPFDRILIAQAMVEGLTLVSSDVTFRQYGGLSLLQA